MKLIITLLLSFITLSSFCQLEVVETEETETIYQNLKGTRLAKFYNEDGTNHYTLYFKNIKYQHITDIKYIPFSNGAELEQFFDLCRKTVKDKKEISTPKYSLKKSLGKQVEVFNSEGGYFYLTISAMESIEKKYNDSNAGNTAE